MLLPREEYDPEHDRPEDLRDHAEDRDLGQVLDAGQVDRRRERDHQDRDHLGVPRRDGEAEEGADVWGGSERHRRDRDEQRPDVEPAGEPGVAVTDQLFAPLVDASGDRIARSDLAERQGHQHLARDDDRDRPDERRARRRQAEGEERVHADDRREVREPEREVAPESERPGQLLLVSERSQLLRIRPDLFSLHPTSLVWGTLGDRRTLQRPRSSYKVESSREMCRGGLCCLAVLLLCLTGSAAAADGGWEQIHVRTFQIEYRSYDGYRRAAYVLVPDWYGPDRHPRLPLIISPHGRGVPADDNAGRWGDLPAVGAFA